MALHYLGRYPEAVVEFERAMALDPNLFEAYYLYAYAARDVGDLETAAKMIQARQRDRARRLSVSASMLSQMYEKLGRIEESREMARSGIEAAERALAQHPDVSLPLAIGAGALVRLGERERALEWCARALAIAPDDPLTLYNVACGYALLGETGPGARACSSAGVSGRTPGRRAGSRSDTDFDNIRGDPRFQAFFGQGLDSRL